ncbi:MAG TPA: hypothetical protein VFY05_05015, partial [Candidatus Angelobacter sp.]|nr:hypothetical protein [Candidatus Angelobacter sp.]
MPTFDLVKTHEVADLLFVEREQRDSNWVRRFYQSVGDAGMVTTPEQVLEGPDGFSYFVLNMPSPERNFELLSAAQVLDFCLENSLGLVVEPFPEPPERVISFGQLWSKKQLGRFDVFLEPYPDNEVPTGLNTPEIPINLAGKQAVLAGQPSESYFPAFARNAVRKFLVEQGIQSPGALLLCEPREKPTETIVFSVFAEDFAENTQFENLMQRLSWFFPPHYRLSS